MKSYGVTIQIKATAQYFPVVLFIMLYKVFKLLGLWMKSYVVAIQFKATEQWFIYANEILKGDFLMKAIDK